MRKARILVVEDETIIAMELEHSLHNLGYDVTSIVNDAEKAIARAEADQPDLVIMDIRLKGDKDGIEAAEEIRSRWGIPVVFSTAYLDEERMGRAKITAPFGYLLKPIQERELRVTLEMALYVAGLDAEKQKINQQLRESEEKYRIIAEKSSSMIAIFDASGSFIYANPAHQTILGYPPEDLIGKPGFDIIHEDDRNRMAQVLSEAIVDETKEVRETYRACSKNHSIHHLEVVFNGIFDENGRLERIIGICDDVTEKRKIQEKLEKSEKKYRELFEKAPAGIYDIDFRTYRITEINELACEYMGYTKEEILNLPDPLVVMEEDSKQLFLERMEKIRRKEPVSSVESFKLIKKNGELITALLNIDFVYEGEDIVGARVVAYDVTNKQ